MDDLRPNIRKDGVQVCHILYFVCFLEVKIILISIVLIVMVIDFFICLNRVRRSEVSVKGSVYFDATSTITMSPVNFQYCLSLSPPPPPSLVHTHKDDKRFDIIVNICFFLSFLQWIAKI